MRHRLLFQNEYFTIEYNAIDNWLKIVWADRQTTESIQQGYEKALQYIYAQNTPRLLDDQSKVRDLLSAGIDWLAHDWYPRAVKHGLKFHALVYTKNNYSQMTAERLKSKLMNSIVQGFEDIIVAKKWLCDLN